MGMGSANEEPYYNVTLPLTGWAHTHTDPCFYPIIFWPHHNKGQDYLVW